MALEEIIRVGASGKLGNLKIYLDTKEEARVAMERLEGVTARSLSILVKK